MTTNVHPSTLQKEGTTQPGRREQLEETIFRGYLILRFTAVTLRPAVAVLLSAALFSLGHGYEGSAGVVTVGVMGLALALIYLWRESLVAPIVMHFLQDFLGIVLLPLLRVQ